MNVENILEQYRTLQDEILKNENEYSKNAQLDKLFRLTGILENMGIGKKIISVVLEEKFSCVVCETSKRYSTNLKRHCDKMCNKFICQDCSAITEFFANGGKQWELFSRPYCEGDN